MQQRGFSQTPYPFQNQNQPQRQQQGRPQQQQQPYYDPSVTFENVDPDFLRQYQSGAGQAAGQTAPEAAAPASPAPPVKADENLVTTYFIKTELTDKIADIAQNEHNGSVFYAYLSGLAQDGSQQNALDAISGECQKHSGVWSSLYKKFTKKERDAEDRTVNNDVGYAAGIKWALDEEIRALCAIAELYNSLETGDAGTMKTMNYLLYKKIYDISVLQTLV